MCKLRQMIVHCGQFVKLLWIDRRLLPDIFCSKVAQDLGQVCLALNFRQIKTVTLSITPEKTVLLKQLTHSSIYEHIVNVTLQENKVLPHLKQDGNCFWVSKQKNIENDRRTDTF